MCKAISPASFLALTFKSSKKKRVSYRQLEQFRIKVTHVSSSGDEPYDVDWSHDSYLYTMGFYSPVFREEGLGIACDMGVLDKYYDDIISDLASSEIESLSSALQGAVPERRRRTKKS